MILYNSLTNQKEDFKPLRDVVSIYACGPTVYGPPHIGNARASFVSDFLRRSMLFLGYNVKYVSNFTDIDDKMINEAKNRNISVVDLASEMAEVAKLSFKSLRIEEPDVRPYATEYISEMFDMLRSLYEKGYIYEIDEDGLYFRIDKFEEYGKLSKQNLDELNIGERIKENSLKENPRDFVVWKFKKEGEPFWSDDNCLIPDGRPGWHLECSAMIEGIFGDTIDIHMGGMDLKFPHHECEIAQSECSCGRPLANYWLHNGFINMSGEKMSKSLGNIKSVIDLIKVYDPLDIRYFLMSVHYRSPLDFNDQNIKQAIQSRAKIQNLWDRLIDLSSDGSYELSKDLLDDFVVRLKDALSDDLNTSEALSVLFDVVTTFNNLLDDEEFSVKTKENALDFLRSVDKVFGLIRYEKGELSEEQKRIFDERVTARQNKDYALSDKLRDDLFGLGVQVMDGPEGSTYRLL